MDVTNQRGVLAKIATEIAARDANIVSVEMHDKDDRYTTLKFIVEVTDRLHLANIIRRIRNIPHVSKISRR